MISHPLLQISKQSAVADPDLQIRGEPGHQHPDIRGGGGSGLNKNFFRPFGRQLGPKIRGAGVGPPVPYPGSATGAGFRKSNYNEQLTGDDITELN